MKFRWLAILCALAVGMPACDSKSKDKASKEAEDEDEEKSDKKKDKKKDAKDKKSGDAVAETPSTAGATTPAADDEPAPPPAPTEAPKAPMTKEQLTAFIKDESAKMTVEAYESLLLGVADCKVERGGVDYDCQGAKDWRAAYKHKNDEYKKTNEIALKHLRHPSPAVRYEATSPAQSAAFGFDAKDDAGKLYIDALRSEQNDYVLANLVSSAYSGARKSERVRKYVFRYVDHKEARVREAALRTLSPQEVAVEVKGYYAKVLEKTEKDPDEKVRAQACEGLSAAGDPGAVAVYQKLLDASDTAEEIKEGCFSGLIQSWIDFPQPKNPSKEGYELTLKILENPTRTTKFPPSKGILKLGWAKTEFKPYESGKEWHAVAKSFYDKARLVKAMESLALDEKANEWTRDHSLNVLRRLGEQKLLETMAATIKKQTGRESKRLSDNAEKLSKEKD